MYDPRTDIGKPVFMTDLKIHCNRLYENISSYNDTIFIQYLGRTITIFLCSELGEKVHIKDLADRESLKSAKSNQVKE